jgi:hypothetical protein
MRDKEKKRMKKYEVLVTCEISSIIYAYTNSEFQKKRNENKE